MLHLPHASELSLLWLVNMKHCNAVSSPLHSIEDSCVSNRIMNSGAEVCWTCQCRCVCVLESASYFAVWVIRYIVRLGEETAPALRPIRVQDEPKQGLGFLHSYVSLSMCVCVWQIHCPLITHLTSCHTVRICQPVAQGLESVCPVCQCWHATSWFDTDKARNLQK